MLEHATQIGNLGGRNIHSAIIFSRVSHIQYKPTHML